MTFKSVKRRDFFHGVAECCKFVMRVFLMLGFRLVAGEFHSQFVRDALVRQRACE